MNTKEIPEKKGNEVGDIKRVKYLQVSILIVIDMKQKEFISILRNLVFPLLLDNKIRKRNC